jgi:hypothetical protein
MTFDHRTTRLHIAELDREIETLRTERALDGAQSGVVNRARRHTGRVLIAAGEALAGRDGALRTHRV